MKAVIGGMPVLIGQMDEEEELLKDTAIPDALTDIGNEVSSFVSGRDELIQSKGFQNGALAAIVSTWVGAAAGRYLVKDATDGPMWGAMLGGLAALGYAMFQTRR